MSDQTRQNPTRENQEAITSDSGAVMVTPETLTDETLVHALARFYAAEHFHAGSPRISDELARFVGYNTTSVTFEVERELKRRGWLSRPAAGRRVVTEIGRQRIYDAINASAREDTP